MALYLKYRPQNLDELIGQEAVKQTLSTAFDAGKLSHAYLLVGPRGTGKTSTARILAKMVNCESKKAPCNKCSTCISITDGSNLDLIEIDAASNRGIDDIRSLRENIKLAPTGGKKKVYIIDEVHMLTTEAFNALLKTLEEPPAHAVFVLATTEVQKVPLTIMSRTQRLDFKMATQADLVETLKKIAKLEKIEIEEEALKLLAKCSEGSFRDSVKLLDQVSSLGRKITTKDINLRYSKFDDLLALLITLADKSSKDALLQVNKQITGGADTKGLILSLMDALRSILLIKNDLGVQLVSSEYDSDQYKSLVDLSNKFNVSDLSKALDSLQGALEKLKVISIPSLPLELAVVEICLASQSIGEPAVPQIQEVVSTPVSLVSSLDVAAPMSPTVLDLPDREKPQEDRKKSDSPEAITLSEKWTFVLETVRPHNFSLEALLRSAKIVECDGGIVTLEVPYSFHQRILEAPKSRDLLESVLSDVLGKNAKVVTVLGVRPVRVEDIANVEIAADDEIIRAASEIFEGSLVD